MPRTFPELPDWSFDVDEISVGVYRAFGHDSAGRNSEVTGFDPEALIEKCRQKVLEKMSTGYPDNPDLT